MFLSIRWRCTRTACPPPRSRLDLVEVRAHQIALIRGSDQRVVEAMVMRHPPPRTSPCRCRRERHRPLALRSGKTPTINGPGTASVIASGRVRTGPPAPCRGPVRPDQGGRILEIGSAIARPQADSRQARTGKRADNHLRTVPIAIAGRAGGNYAVVEAAVHVRPCPPSHSTGRMVRDTDPLTGRPNRAGTGSRTGCPCRRSLRRSRRRKRR